MPANAKVSSRHATPSHRCRRVISGTEEHVTATLAPDGIDPHLAETCTTKGPDATVWSSYTADGDTLTLYSAAGKMSLTYTKQ